MAKIRKGFAPNKALPFFTRPSETPHTPQREDSVNRIGTKIQSGVNLSEEELQELTTIEEILQNHTVKLVSKVYARGSYSPMEIFAMCFRRRFCILGFTKFSRKPEAPEDTHITFEFDFREYPNAIIESNDGNILTNCCTVVEWRGWRVTSDEVYIIRLKVLNPSYFIEKKTCQIFGSSDGPDPEWIARIPSLKYLQKSGGKKLYTLFNKLCDGYNSVKPSWRVPRIGIRKLHSRLEDFPEERGFELKDVEFLRREQEREQRGRIQVCD